MNNSYNEGNESHHFRFNSYPQTTAIINCALNVPLIFISIVGNVLVLAAILRTPSLHSPSAVFLCFLAISDLLVGLVTQPVYVADELKHNPFLHEAVLTLTYLTSGVSLGLMAAVSVDRFMALHYHMRYPYLMTITRAIYTSATLSFGSFALSFHASTIGTKMYFSLLMLPVLPYAS